MVLRRKRRACVPAARDELDIRNIDIAVQIDIILRFIHRISIVRVPATRHLLDVRDIHVIITIDIRHVTENDLAVLHDNRGRIAQGVRDEYILEE